MDEFAQPGAPQVDFVFTVCDNAAGEVCPIWPGQPMTAHWGVPDPAAVEGSHVDVARAFADAYGRLNNRISIFVALPFQGLDRLSLQKRLDSIAKTPDGPAHACRRTVKQDKQDVAICDQTRRQRRY